MSLSQLLWLGSAATSFVITAYYGVLAMHIWLRSRSLFGPTSPDIRQTIIRLLNVSRQKNRLALTRLILFYGGLSVFAVAIAAKEWLGLIVTLAPFVLIGWMDVRTTTQPVALILGTSTHSSIRRHHTIKNRLSPLRVVSLLDVEIPWDTRLANKMALDSYRTTNEDDWWLVITMLMETTPILIIDAAAETLGVIREARHILSKTDLWRKCLFLTPVDGSAPVIDHHLNVPETQRRALQLVCYNELVDVISKKVNVLNKMF